jgi:hypothetical protein
LVELARKPGLVFIHGHEQSSRLAHYFLAAPLMRGETVLFLDAANCFDPFKVAKFARLRQGYGGQARCEECSPEEFLRRVRVSRAFTCFQMAELIERTAGAARRFGARCVVLTGFPDIFDDEEIPAAQAKAAFLRALAVLRRWPAYAKASLDSARDKSAGRPALRLSALAFSDGAAHPSPLRRWLERQLSQWAAAVYRLAEGPIGLRLLEEKSVSVGQTLLSALRARSKARALLSVVAGSLVVETDERYDSPHRRSGYGRLSVAPSGRGRWAER